MEKWIDVVTDPLGLAGFALFLVFTVLTRLRKENRPSWLTPVFIVMAFVSLIGGIWLASINRESNNITIRQVTHGDKSPAVTGVTGDVTITIQDYDDEENDKAKQ
jgi:hypothetical protein